jgi:hypothetical protein
VTSPPPCRLTGGDFEGSEASGLNYSQVAGSYYSRVADPRHSQADGLDYSRAADPRYSQAVDPDCSQVAGSHYSRAADPCHSQVVDLDYSQAVDPDCSQVADPRNSQADGLDYSRVRDSYYSQAADLDYSRPGGRDCSLAVDNPVGFPVRKGDGFQAGSPHCKEDDSSEDDSPNCRRSPAGWCRPPVADDTRPVADDKGFAIQPRPRDCNRRSGSPNSSPIHPIPTAGWKPSTRRCRSQLRN